MNKFQQSGGEGCAISLIGTVVGSVLLFGPGTQPGAVGDAWFRWALLVFVLTACFAVASWVGRPKPGEE